MKIRNLGSKQVGTLKHCHNKILTSHIVNLDGIRSVLDAGGRQETIDKEPKPKRYKDYFPKAEYYSVDLRHGDSIGNHFKMDLHDLSSLNRKFDLILCTSVLEHVKNPFQVAKQLESVSSKYIFVVVPFLFQLHRNKIVRDYWRFTDDGLRELFCDSEEVWIKSLDSVIRVVDDTKTPKDTKEKKGRGWKNIENASSGFAALFRKKI